MIAVMRTVQRHEQGKPAAGLAIIAAIFAAALTIKLLSPATRDAVLLVAEPELPSRALLIFTTAPEPVSSAEVSMPVSAREAPSVETTIVQLLTFDTDPGEAPRLSAATLMPAPLPLTAMAVPPEREARRSPVASAFTTTRSAFRLAVVKTGEALVRTGEGVRTVRP